MMMMRIRLLCQYWLSYLILLPRLYKVEGGWHTKWWSHVRDDDNDNDDLGDDDYDDDHDDHDDEEARWGWWFTWWSILFLVK